MADEEKKKKFNFEEMKAAAMSDDDEVRKRVLVDYFERYNEFPSYLYDNADGIDERLLSALEIISSDPDTPKQMRDGIASLMERLGISKPV